MDGEKRHELLELAAVFFLGLLLRLYAGRNTLQEGNVVFIGYDEFYHIRRALFTASHFPDTLWFDSYINYPYGTSITWPPLFDQLIAGISLALGKHSQQGIEMVGAVLPIFLGSIAIIVVYIMVREIFNKRVALMSALMTALAPYFMQKSMLGATDHHCLEALLLLCFTMFLVLALSRPSKRFIFSAAAGVLMAGLAYTWIGAAAYFGLLLVYAAVQLTIDLKDRESNKGTIITVLTALGISFALTIPFRSADWLAPSFLGLGGILAGVALLSALWTFFAYRNIPWPAFPASLLVAAFVLILAHQITGNWWIFSEVRTLIAAGGGYIFGGGMIGKISEAQPLFSRLEIFFSSSVILSNLGWNMLFSAAALAALIAQLWHMRLNDERRKRQLLFLVFAVYTIVLTVGQIRFLYISSITMGILISFLFYHASEHASKLLKGREQLARVLIPLMFLILVIPTAMEAIAITDAVPQIAGDWEESLSWLEKNSNATSWYSDPKKTAEYSVMSWWDYGNWILYEAKRPVVANNFQTGIDDSSKFFLSEDEENAASVLDARRSRYIITDYDMLYGKFSSIAIWAGKIPSSYQSITDFGRTLSVVPTRKLMETVLARLHFFDGSSLGHMRLIYESDTIRGENPPTHRVKVFEYVPGAIIRVYSGPNQKVGALLNMTSNQERPFVYVNEAISKDGSYEIRVPYSTERKYDTHAATPYLVFAGNGSMNIKKAFINVTEEDVLTSKVIEVRI